MLHSYKRGQGRLVRGPAFMVGVIASASIGYSVRSTLADALGGGASGAIGILLALGLTVICWALLQRQSLADYLIDVEAETFRITWPTWPELFQTTKLVLTLMAVLAGYLFFCDLIWQAVLRFFSVLAI